MEPQEQPVERRRGAWLDLLLIVLLALAARALFVLAYPEPARSGDAWEYIERARMLASGRADFLGDTRWHAWQTWLRPPGYYLFLAGIRKLPGEWQSWLVWLQAGFSALTAGALYLTARPLFGRAAAVASGVLFALYPETVFHVTRVLSEPPYMLLVTGALAALAAATVGRSAGWGALAGLLLGLAAHFRSAPILFAPVAALLVLAAVGRRGVRPAAAVLLATVATVAPWCVRNSMLYGHPMGMDDLAVVNLLQTAPQEEVVPTHGADLEDWQEWRGYYQRLQAANRDRSLSRRSGEILLRGLGRMAAQPARTVRRFAANLGDFFSLYPEGFYAWALRDQRPQRELLLRRLTNGGYLAVVALALAGLWWAVPVRACWPVLGWLVFNAVVINLVFHPEMKYRLPLMPVVVLLAGVAVARLVAGPLRPAPGRRRRTGGSNGSDPPARSSPQATPRSPS